MSGSPITLRGWLGSERHSPAWPLTVVFLGFPLWWILGVAYVMFLVMAVPMASYLWRRRRTVVVPRGFGFWLLFVAWVMLGVLVLWADAPGAVPGGDADRLLVFGWRLAWYVAFTIVLLYVGNLTERELPTDKVMRLLGYMFVVTTAGGLLGSFLPQLPLTSLVEWVLPARIDQIAFIRTIINPETADITEILGFQQSRPKAPFAYANTWGAAYAFFLPFFVITWVIRVSGWRRLAGVGVLLASLWPAVYSLNRMLWAAIGVMAVFVVIKLVAGGRARTLGWVTVAALSGALLVGLSPLPGLVQTRLDNPHSDSRRENLASETVISALTGSPLIGFGSTRDVQGDLGSVAGGDRPGCPSCGSPPLGTNGSLWLFIFAHGLVGAVAFCAFFIRRFAVHWRETSACAVAGCSVLVACSLFLFTYDLVEVPLFTVMIAVALMWRSGRDLAAPADVVRSGRHPLNAGPR